ncbi:hypothetical protein QZH41_002189 [Actinostola sp. cb2023]|nr:hypothetical protein QZH41_002189 [Actinostola sp. cb2023]
MVRDMTNLMAKGGFRLTKWLSNKKEVLQDIQASERAKSVSSLNLDLDKLPTEITLGVLWDVNKDKFTFKIALKEKPRTRRGIISSTSSIYDPLGFISPIVLPAKKLLQDLTRRSLGWDEDIEEEDSIKWESWLKDIPNLADVTIERSIIPENFERKKWIQPRRNFAVGDLVLIEETNLPRNQWKLGRIIEVFPDGKGFVRPAGVAQGVHEAEDFRFYPSGNTIQGNEVKRMEAENPFRVHPHLMRKHGVCTSEYLREGPSPGYWADGPSAKARWDFLWCNVYFRGQQTGTPDENSWTCQYPDAKSKVENHTAPSKDSTEDIVSSRSEHNFSFVIDRDYIRNDSNSGFYNYIY